MELQIKQLQQGSQIFVPQTIAEAVLVNQEGLIVRLDEVLNSKSGTIITPAGSGLNSYQQDGKIVLTHTNNITPDSELKPVQIAYDSHGHITKASPILPLNIIVDDTKIITYTGNEESTLELGDDFATDENNKIKLNWSNI